MTEKNGLRENGSGGGGVQVNQLGGLHCTKMSDS